MKCIFVIRGWRCRRVTKSLKSKYCFFHCSKLTNKDNRELKSRLTDAAYNERSLKGISFDSVSLDDLHLHFMDLEFEEIVKSLGQEPCAPDYSILQIVPQIQCSFFLPNHSNNIHLFYNY